MDSGDLNHLFEPFRPGVASPRPGGGTGCGLYLVKQFSDSLHGRVAVDSTPGRGTCFTIDLPLG
jgi:signal transduction histidine kinase